MVKSVVKISGYVVDVLGSALLLMKTPLSVIVAIAATLHLIFASAPSVAGAIHAKLQFDVCSVPVVWMLFPECPAVTLPDSAIITRSDFPTLLQIQHHALDQLVASSTANVDLVLNLKHSELLVQDLAVIVRESNLMAKDVLEEILTHFVADARASARALQVLSAKIQSTSDRCVLLDRA